MYGYYNWLVSIFQKYWKSTLVLLGNRTSHGYDSTEQKHVLAQK